MIFVSEWYGCYVCVIKWIGNFLYIFLEDFVLIIVVCLFVMDS